MKTSLKFLLAMAAAIFLALAVSAQQGKDAPLVVIVNPANPVTSMSKADLHKIFAGDKTTWNNGQVIIPYLRSAPAHERDVLLSAVMKMTDVEYQEYWIKKIYSGQSVREPVQVRSAALLLEAVREQKGGIALINVTEVKSGVKIIPVEDLFPGTASH